MKVLLDTHTFLWWITQSKELSSCAQALMGDGRNQLYWSAASVWEAGIKYALGRLPLPDAPGVFLPKQLNKNGVLPLAINHSHAAAASALPSLHADPFDRMLVAQAQLEGMVLLSRDRQVRRYDVDVRW